MNISKEQIRGLSTEKIENESQKYIDLMVFVQKMYIFIYF